MEFVTDELSRIEREIDDGTDRATLLQSLRVLGLDDFAQLMFAMPDARYPRIRRSCRSWRAKRSSATGPAHRAGT